MDLSDGLADGLRQIAEASAVGMTIDAAALPVDPAARDLFAARRLDVIIEALTGGDDYELLIAVRPRTQRRLAAAVRHAGTPLTRIGRCTAAPGITVCGDGAASIDLANVSGGFAHFR